MIRVLNLNHEELVADRSALIEDLDGELGKGVSLHELIKALTMYPKRVRASVSPTWRYSTCRDKELVDASVKGDRAVVGAIQAYRADDDAFYGAGGGESDFNPTGDEFLHE